MKWFAATALSLSLVASACSYASQTSGSSGAAASSAESSAITITRSGSQPSRQGPAENFTGSVRVDPFFNANAPARASAARVTFEPAARTAWHTHPLGQRLIVTAGTGWVQPWGGPVQEIRPGDVVWIPPGQKHWHGATATTSMTHIAVQEHLDGKTVDWMEHVTDAQYGAPARVAAAGARTPPTPAQRLIGDFAPKLVELTDNVLFGDVWARPDLSPRDRSLVTVSALIASGAASIAPGESPRQRRDAGRGGRDHHASGVLRGLAERDHRHWRGEGSVREALKLRTNVSH